MKAEADDLKTALHDVFEVLSGTLESHRTELEVQDVGTIGFLGPGVVRVMGLRGVRSRELLRFPGDRLGMAFDVSPQETGVVFAIKPLIPASCRI